MQGTLVAGCALAIALVGAFPAQAGPNKAHAAPGTQVIHAKTTSNGVFGNGSSDTVSVFFGLTTADAVTAGVLSAQVSVQFFDFTSGTFSSISCSGPEFVTGPNVISVDPKDGRAVVLVTLDPASPSCFADIASPITLNLSGQPTGLFHEAFVGTRTVEGGGFTSTSKFRNEAWDVILNGSVGSITGAFPGSTQVGRADDKVKQK